MKEAAARIKINKLLEAAGWRFFPDANGPANIQLESGATFTKQALDELGDNFEKISKGFIDYLLLNEKGFPFIVLEAKAEHINPLSAKEQARKYARSKNCRFIILSNGNLHYFWDLEHGNPYAIIAFPRPDSVAGYQKAIPDTKRLVGEMVAEDYIALTQKPNYASDAAWKNEAERAAFIKANGLRFLRPYQQRAIVAIQKAVERGSERFLLEMATGTGKTLTAAGIIKLFLRTGNARRVLFLVDRLELETQAEKAFKKILSNDYTTVIYKEKRGEWQGAEIVVSTVQSLLFDNKHQRLFSPTDFDLVISDEAHRSIGGNARAVFEYFVGYKLGLTATPRDYLKNAGAQNRAANDPREVERRILLDTYRTFGCDDGQPTFRYSLLDGVKDGFLINPTVVDARSNITTQLLSDKGFIVTFREEEGAEQEESFNQGDFEKGFVSEATNQLFCKTFLENALRDPISGEIGKSIVFAVSQNHAAKLAQIFNQIADRMYPGKYQSDFAAQVTSQVDGAQQMTINFADNKLLGSANFLPFYKTSKARVCVTVGMMTTGYDCTDILNLGLFRPIFSPTDFVQIKGRGTRQHDFREEFLDEAQKENVKAPKKTAFKLFDFFGNCEYFEEKFNYDEVLKLPRPRQGSGEGSGGGGEEGIPFVYEHTGGDILSSVKEEIIGYEGMRIDRELFANFANRAREDRQLAGYVEAGQWDRAVEHVNKNLFDKPAEYYTLEKLRKSVSVDRRINIREILELIFNLIPRLKSRAEVLEEEFSKFVADYKPDPGEAEAIPVMRAYFEAYASNDQIRHIIETGEFTDLSTNPVFSLRDYKAVPEKYRKAIPDYIKDYVSLNQFAA
ncbi:MAG: DEAD/DEAH box helicase family protein [Betaproteobacteria bacterium]|nr:DEAD/DEAH box helicase family protein [Betaproteobacteria bacterium]